MNTRSDMSMESLKRTLNLFEENWPDLMDAQCNPLDVTLPLLSSGKIEEFSDLKKRFAEDLRNAVNANYSTFNDSIGAYGISVETLSRSQDKITDIRKSLNSVDEVLSYKSNILGELNSKSKKYSQTLMVMNKINFLKKNLMNLQTFIENQEFKKAVDMVKEINDTANEHGLFKIEGLHNMQIKLESLTTLILDGLIDEISGFIYMKNTSYSSVSSNRVPVNKGLQSFIKRLNKEILDEDEELQVENGKFDEVMKRFKLVQKLNKENDCLTKLVESSEREIKLIIKRCVDEIKSKHPSQIEMNLKSSRLHDLNHDPYRSFNMLQGMNGIIIKEVFNNIFNKLLFLLQRHIAIYEISKTNGYKYRLERIWDEIQKQLSLIICNYIVDISLLNDLDELELKTNDNKVKNSPFTRIPKPFETLKRGGTMFQFSELSLNSLAGDLLDSLNGIFINQNDETISTELNFEKSLLNVSAKNSIFIGVDDINESKKNIVVPANVFNMAYIIKSFMMFTSNLSKIYPLNSSKMNVTTNFFNQFMELVFVSQLENTLIYQFDKLCENKWEFDQLLEASLSFKQFFNKVMILLDTTLYYRESYVKIVFKLFRKMFNKFKFMKEKLLRTNDQLLNKWTTDKNLKNISNDIVENLLNLNKPENANNLSTYIQNLNESQTKEFEYALQIGEQYIPSINPSNFLTLEHMRSLVDLLASLLNVLSWLPNLKHKVSERGKDMELYEQLTESWALSIFEDSEFPLSNLNLNVDIRDNTTPAIENFDDNHSTIFYSNYTNDISGFIALDERSEKEFNHLCGSFKDLMNDVEILIRYEIKIECIWCMIQMMVSKQQWCQEGNESVDIGVNKFCNRVNGISRIFNRVSKNIINESKDEVRIRIFSGIGFWVDRLSIFESRRISVMGKNGWVKMLVNLRVLQQIIRNIDFIEIDSNFDLSKNIMNGSLKYFQFGVEGERSIMNIEHFNNDLNVKFNDDDWKNLIRLIYSEKLKNDREGTANKKYMAAQARLLKNLATK